MKFIDYLHLKDVGLLELVFALYPILAGYQYGSIPLAILVLLIMDIMAFFRMGRLRFAKCKPMAYLAVFVVLHIIIWAFFLENVSSSYFNNAIYYISVFVSFFVIGSALRYKDIVGSINWVTLLVIGGLLYQLPIILSGGFTHPLKLPFLPTPESSRLFEEVWRPTSFFWEPQSIVSFLLIPLFLSITEKKYVWMIVVAISMLLSTSTTGIIYVFATIALFIYNNRKQKGSVVFIAIVMVALYLFMMNSDLFLIGTEKLANSNISTDNRTAQGWWICSSMPIQYWILGAPYEDAFHYYLAGGAASNANIVVYDTSIYMATFWMVIFFYGIVGLVFYLAPYFYMIKRDRLILPFMFCLIMALFSNPDFVKGAFLFDLVFAYVFVNRNNLDNKYDNRSYRVGIR